MKSIILLLFRIFSLNICRFRNVSVGWACAGVCVCVFFLKGTVGRGKLEIGVCQYLVNYFNAAADSIHLCINVCVCVCVCV